MDNKQFKELTKLLKSIETKMEILINILKASMPKPKVTPEERKILKLCDKKHTIDDMMKATGKTKTNVNFLLSQLRKKGLITSIRMKDKLVYEKI